MYYSHDKLRSFCYEVFKKIGCSKEDAELAANVLIEADLRGVDSHGIARLSGYIRLWEADRVNSVPHIKIVHETPSTALVDGDSGLGLVVAPKAMQIAIDKARVAGTGWVAVRNSNHFGIAGYHSMMAIQHDMIGISMTNASPLVSPTFSRERLLGTNPIAVAIPAGSQPPYVADFATTTVANGKLEMYQRKNMDAPVGWVQDKNGDACTNVNVLKEGGALLPLGSSRDFGSHKGYCLGSMVDIFSAVFSGANYGPWVPPFVSYLPLPENPVGKGIGHFFGAMRVDAFRPVGEFKSHMDNWITRFRDAKAVDGQEKVLIPGDPEREMTSKRKSEGIPLMDSVVAELTELSKKLAVPFVA